MNLRQEIRNTITEICIEKSNNRIMPVHALFLEIAGRIKSSHDEIKECMNTMIRDGELEWGRTANDKYFRNLPRKNR